MKQYKYQTIVEKKRERDFDMQCNALATDGWEPAFSPLIITDGNQIIIMQQWRKEIVHPGFGHS